MEASCVSVAYPSIAVHLFGKSAMHTKSIPKLEYSRWIRGIVAMCFNRYRKVFEKRVEAVKRLQSKVDAAFEGAHLRSC